MKVVLYHQRKDAGFDLTPVIDVVFLLIIFFMLVCQFGAAEHFEALLPDKIQSADPTQLQLDSTVSVNVVQQEGKIVYAIGSDVLSGDDTELLPAMISAGIDSRLADGSSSRIVRLRCDKHIPFEKIRPVLAGIARSRAEKIQWAAFNE
ncbi:MAG: biopolymer transporter ExbD [Sedimentisphaerales bacterium]|nr:biopolymer transporter ExbD [Sedimentisphaerales bacterium]